MPACPTSTRASSRSTAKRARWVAGRRAAVPSSAAPAAPREARRLSPAPAAGAAPATSPAGAVPREVPRRCPAPAAAAAPATSPAGAVPREAPRLSPAAAAVAAPAISPAAAAEVAPRAARPLPVPAAAAAVAASKVAAPRAGAAAAELPASGVWAVAAAVAVAAAALARRPVGAGVGAAALRPANTRNRVSDKGGRMSDRPASVFLQAIAELFGCARQRRHLAAGDAAAAGLFGDAPAVGENAAVEQILDQRRLLGHRIIAPDLALHGFGRAAAVERDQGIPAALMRGGEVLDQASDLKALRRRNVGAPGEHGGERGLRRRIVVLLGTRQRHDEPSGEIVRQPVHVVDLGREQKLADVGEYRVGRDRAGRVASAVDRSRHPAGEK